MSTAVKGEMSSSLTLPRKRCLISSYPITDMDKLIYCSWFTAMRISPLHLSASSSKAIYTNANKSSMIHFKEDELGVSKMIWKIGNISFWVNTSFTLSPSAFAICDNLFAIYKRRIYMRLIVETLIKRSLHATFLVTNNAIREM